MHTIRHQHKADAPAGSLGEEGVEHAQYNPFRMIVVQQSATPEDRERHEMCVQGVVDNAAFWLHMDIMANVDWRGNLFRLSPPR